MLQLADIQGLIVRGYKELPQARYVLLSFPDAARVAARAWVAGLPVTSAAERSPRRAINLAFTFAGMQALMGDALDPEPFARELIEGMAGSVQRSRLLGDVGDQAPSRWLWGAPRPLEQELHAVLLLFAPTEPELQQLEQTLLAAAVDRRELEVIRKLDTHTLSDGEHARALFREHFGFRDGVAQPLLAGNAQDDEAPPAGSPADRAANTIPAGEVVFGHPDAYGRAPHGAGEPALATNGSFMVLRQLEQDVFQFWRTMQLQAERLQLDPILLASKLVGRWPSGAPLVMAPEADAAGLERFDAFGYRERDPTGARCPFGSHVRRSNPRDDLVADAEESLRLTKIHRVMRRGRPYGAPIVKPLDPERFLPQLEALEARDRAAGSPPRGLHFLCFNTNLSRQFEFVQSTWNDNPRFAEGRNAPDPLIGRGDADFELPLPPVVRRVTGLPRFVTMRGGAYFFMPGLAGVKHIAG